MRNATVETADGAHPPGNDPFDVIVLAGSVGIVPHDLLARLNPGGRLFAIVGQAPAMTAQLITRTGDNAFTTENLFETDARRLRGFPEKERFVF